MSKLKDKLYDYAVKKNGRVWYEYERYVREHIEEHHLHRFSHIKLLIKLNWFYRVKKGNTPYLYWDVPLCENKVNKECNVNRKSEVTKDEKKLVEKKGNVFCGIESECTDLPSPYHFAQSLLKYDVISFDIFDTLIIRPFSDPKDLFLFVQNKLEYDNFYDLRIKCELEARSAKEKYVGNREVNIKNIYDLIEYKTGINADIGISIELEFEKEFCFFNPYMQEVLNILEGYQKRVILVSDMYYPHDMMMEILSSAGIHYFEKLYVSCDYEKNKSTAELYKIVCEDYKQKKICHIGDNVKSDIDIPKLFGMDTKYYPNVHSRGNRYRVCTRAMTKIIGSAYAGIVNAHLWNGIKTYSFMYEYGFIYGGLYVVGYMNWVNKFVRENNVDKIIFLARDGYIYHQIYKKFFGDEKCSYLLWSRALTAKLSVKTEREEFIKFIKLAKRNFDNQWIRPLFDNLGISELLNDKTEYEIEQIGREDNWIDFLYSKWNILEELLQENINTIKEKILETIGDSKTVAIVDVGWNGTSAYQIQKIMSPYKDIKIYSLLVGALNKTGNENRVIEGKEIPYAFSITKNRNLYDLFTKNNNKGAAYFELFTQACSPMLKNYVKRNKKIEYEFFRPTPQRYENIIDIHKGINDFCETWMSTFGRYEFMNNIEGYDALNPYRVLISDPYYLNVNNDYFKGVSEIFF